MVSPSGERLRGEGMVCLQCNNCVHERFRVELLAMGHYTNLTSFTFLPFVILGSSDLVYCLVCLLSLAIKGRLHQRHLTLKLLKSGFKNHTTGPKWFLNPDLSSS